MTPEEYFDGHPEAYAVFERVRDLLDETGPYDVRVTKSQVAFRRRRGFAYLWMPGRYVAHPASEVVLTVALGRHHPSTRFKEVVHPSSLQWIHHLEVHDVADLDDEVAQWLTEAADRAG